MNRWNARCYTITEDDIQEQFSEIK